MSPEEIRKMYVPHMSVSNEVQISTLRVMQELAAQIAELNHNLRVKSALDAGEGYPE